MRITLAILFSLFLLKVNAQSNVITSINISLPANPDANTVNWGTATSMLTISAIAQSQSGHVNPLVENIKILVIIKQDGKKVCGTYSSSSAPDANFNSISKVWSGANAVALLGKDCTLPPGNYELSVQFFRADGAVIIPLSPEKIKSFTIKGKDQQSYQPPQNIMPNNGKVFNMAEIKKPITFRWTPIIPKPQDPITYRLRVWQLMQGQTGVQAMKANQPIITKDVDNITQAIITNLITGPCKPPYMCDLIWTVQALNKDGKPIGDNNGTSQPSSFSVTDDGTNPVDNSKGNRKSLTTTTGCGVLSTKTYHTGDIISLSGDFKMTLTANPTGLNDSLSGTGTVIVKWIGLLKVQFQGIKITSDDKLCKGIIYTSTDPSQTYPTQWAVNVLNNTSAGSWTINKIKNLSKYIQTHKSLKPLVKSTNQVNGMLATNPVSMPLGYFKNDDSSNAIGFTEMTFKPDVAEFTVIASLNTSKIFKNAGNTFNGTDTIALKGTGIVFTNGGLKAINGSIKLLAPIIFTYANTGTENLKMTFNTDGNGHIGNSIEFSDTSNEYWNYNFDVDVQLPKQWVVPVDLSKTNVAMNFQASITNWDDFIVTGNLPECTIPNSNGIGIKAGSITYDHSDIGNVVGMEFPDNYSGDSTEMFTGFYLKDFSLTLPDQLRSYADTSKAITIGAENLIIDKDGLSGKIYANNVLNYPIGNIGNLGASIDTVNIKLNNSVLTEAKMLGKITLPMSAVDSMNAVRYSALFTTTHTNSSGSVDTSTITFSLIPDRKIKTKFLGDGLIQIDQTSTLNLTLSKSGLNKRAIDLGIDLNGKLSYPAGNILDIGSTIPLDLDLSCTFQHLGMTYKKDAQESFTFNVGQWSFASPQKKLSGFPFTITNVKPKIEPISTSINAEKQYLFKGGIEFVVKINLGSKNSSISISGDSKIELIGAIESSKYTPPSGSSSKNLGNPTLSSLSKQSQLVSGGTNLSNLSANAKADYGFLTQLKPVYLGINVKSINIDANLSAVSIKGNIEFYKHDPIYGNGFKGDLIAKFKTMDLSIQAGAVFGNTKYIPNNTNGFKYWMVQAQVVLPPPGIAFLPGIVFRGFGAGVYSRMQMTPPTTFNPLTANGSTFGGATFTPCDTISIGFKVKAIIATAKEETFNGSVGLSGEFNTSGGMNFIQIDGLFNCGSKIGEENKSFANGGITVKYDFPHKIFDMKALVNINTDVIKTISPINTHFYIDGIKNEWAFTCGVPDTLNTVRLFDKFNVSQYLMFGNKIPIPQGFMPVTLAGLHGVGLYPTSLNQSAVGPDSKTGKGFAFGIGVNASDKDEHEGLSIGCLIKKNGSLSAGVKWFYNIGGEFDASLLQYNGCDGLGHTGWRVKASVAFYFTASVNGYYRRCNGKSGTVPLISIGTGVYANAEFPNPFYAEGGYAAHATILSIASFDYTATFKVGQPCGGTVTSNPNIVYNQEDAADNLSYSLIKNILTPSTSTDVSRTTYFSVLLNYAYNEPFDIQEQQTSGQIKVRTFKANYTVELTQDSALPITNKPLKISTLKKSTLSIDNTVQNTSAPSIIYNTTFLLNKDSVFAKNMSGMNSLEDLSLTDGGYDEMGAKIFKLTALTNVSLANAPANALKANTSYKFTIRGALQELINGNWQAVNHPNTGVPVKQSKSLYFKTNSDGVTNTIQIK